MDVTLRSEDLDRVVPFGVIVDDQLRIQRLGPSFARLGIASAGQPLWEVFAPVRPIAPVDFRSLVDGAGELIIVALAGSQLRFRFQSLVLEDPARILLVGAPVVASSGELEAAGLTPADFAGIDQTPDLLLLQQGVERSLRDLGILNSELLATTHDLTAANRDLTHAEARYRSIVELQPLVMYIDQIGPTPVAEFVSPGVEAWLGYSVSRWTEEPGFFLEIIHPDDRQRIWRAHVASDRDNTPFDHEFRIVAADGHVVWIRNVDNVVEDEQGGSQRVGFMLDITDAKHAEFELRDTTSRLSRLLSHMHSGVLVEDASRSVVLANEVLFGIFHSASLPSDLVGRPVSVAFSQLISSADRPSVFLRRTEELLNRRWPVLGESLELSDGRVLEFDFEPIVQEGSDLGAIWMFRDITDRVQYQHNLAQARDQAIAASDAKGQFLASMSHEIRTPMHGILATIELLQTTPLDVDQRELADVVSASAQALVGIINDILDLNKVEAGRVDLVTEPMSIVEVVNGVAGLLRSQAQAKGLVLSSYVDPVVPPLVLGDASRLRQILINLAGNAVKFTASGSVDIDARYDTDASGEPLIVFEVRDSGRGIPADRIAMIFDPFVQARRGQDGTGLGLAIADRLVSLMGGSLSVDSVEREGSRFRFSIALPAVSGFGASANEPPKEAETQTAAVDAIALVVDDSEVQRALLMRQVARLGIPARAVSSGAQAIEALTHRVRYGVVLLDIDMPGMDGFEVTAAIRAFSDPRVSRTPIVGLVAAADEDFVARCRAAGMDGLLRKPVDLGELRHQIDRIISIPALKESR